MGDMLQAAAYGFFQYADNTALEYTAERGGWVALLSNGAYVAAHGETAPGRTKQGLARAHVFATAEEAARALYTRGLGPARAEMPTRAHEHAGNGG